MGDEALQWYMTACLIDPTNVSIDNLRSKPVKEMLLSLQSEADDGIDDNDLAAWLPAWGVMNGLFRLPLPPDLLDLLLDSRNVEDIAQDPAIAVPTRWFWQMLLAERQRKSGADSASSRRAMKNLSPFMFNKYIELMVSH